MILAEHLRKTLLEPLKERQREEGRVEGRAEGREESDAKWLAWNERREAAAARGEPFDEPPPGSGG